MGKHANVAYFVPRREIMNYKSGFSLLGLPLIHIKTGGMEEGRYQRGIAKGWIAIGDISFGILFSAGGAAFGGIAIGGFSVGLLSFAGLAIGVFAFGGGAIGIVACGGGAIAWQAALGGFAMAKEFAMGGVAIANHANDHLAKEFMEQSRFFSASKLVMEHSRWFILLTFFPGIQAICQRIKQKQNKKDRAA